LVCSSTLIQISAASKVFFAFTRLESIWKNLYLEKFPSQIEYYQNWRKSLIFKERGKRLDGEDVMFQIKGIV
jgi:hypothetical protein